VAPRLGSACVARWTREHHSPGHGHEGVNNPAAEIEQPEDRDIHQAKSPPPACETFTRAWSAPPPLTASLSATSAPAPTQSIPPDTTNPLSWQLIASGESQETATQMQPIQPTPPAPNQTTIRT